MPPPSRGLQAFSKTTYRTARIRKATGYTTSLSCQYQSRHNSSTPKTIVPPKPALAYHDRPPQRQLQPFSPRYASSTSSSTLKTTPLHDLHTSLGAKLVPFAGYSMPLTYPDQSHPESHLWTRSAASLFDVSHMVQHKLSGPLAESFLMTITPSALDTLPKHNSTLSVLLNDKGGIVDDTVITRLGRESFYFVTNAGCREQDIDFIQTEMDKFLATQPPPSDPSTKPISWHILTQHSLLALQGPLSQSLLQPLIHTDPDDDAPDPSTNPDLSTLYFSHSRWLQLSLPASCTKENTALSTPSLLISRTGYTGEDGFEISIPPESGSSSNLAISIAKALLSSSSTGESAQKCNLAGLAARDSLRLEACMCLYGHDIDLATTPPEAGLGWVVAKSRRNSNADIKFNGHDIITPQLASPKSIPKRRVGISIEPGPAAREGAEIISLTDDGEAGEVLGKVTSGCPAPSLQGENIAMGYVKGGEGWHKSGTKVGVKVRGKVRRGEVTKMPFVEAKFYRGDGSA